MKSSSITQWLSWRSTRVRKWEPKKEVGKDAESPRKSEDKQKKLGTTDRVSWLGAAVMGQDSFLPAFLIDATWHLTMTRESAHCLLKNRQYNLLLELNAVWHQARKIFGKDTRIMIKMGQIYQPLRKAKKGPRKSQVSFQAPCNMLLTVKMNCDRMRIN